MARFSARMPIVAKRNTEGDTYSDGMAIGKLVQCTVTPAPSNVKLYGDDGIAEESNEVTSVAVTVNVTTLPVEVAAFIFGAKYTAANEEEPAKLDFSGEDEAPYVGYAYIGGEKVDGKVRYKVTLLPKTKFTLPSDDYSTKGETIAFSTPSISATAYVDEKSGKWKTEYYFETAEAAVAYIKTLTGYSG